jgi:DNA modification methylase
LLSLEIAAAATGKTSYNIRDYRLHPYLGKFIPQLVEWFLRRYFREGDWILDPFMGSGTTLVR